MSKSCVICGTEESEGELLLEAPCSRHWVCADDVGRFFENATNNESLFPPQCCGTMFMLEDYEEFVSFDTAWAYQMKQQGEYAVLAKFRVYCANPPCGKFLHPGSHIEDPETKITCAICEAEECGKLTCVKCKALLDQDTQNHECQQNEDEKKFRQTANEKGYQECFVCGVTVELAEACNHITCECGNSFCYICGENWPGLHGCPHYGPPVYDEEGYNQDGYHRDNGLNREGLTRRQEMIRHEEDEEEDNGDEDEDDEVENREWEVLQHLTPDQRLMINQLPHGPREDALDQFRITLFETQGITFDQFAPPPPDPLQEELGDDGDALEDDNGENTEDDQGEDPQLEDASPTPTSAEVLANELAEELLATVHREVQNGVIDGMEPQEDTVPMVHHSDDEDNADPLDDDDGDYFIPDEEGTQEGRFADDQSEVLDFDTDTPPADRNSEETSQRLETEFVVDPPSQVQQNPDNYEFTFASGFAVSTDPLPLILSSDGPHTIVARGFVSGTIIENVAAIMTHYIGHYVIGWKILGSDPLIAQLRFGTKQGADDAIHLFHGKKADGQVLDVRMEDEDL